MEGGGRKDDRGVRVSEEEIEKWKEGRKSRGKEKEVGCKSL